MDKIEKLKNVWLEEFARRINKKDFLEVIEDDAESDENNVYHHRFKCNIYTDNYQYRITAIERGLGNGYLGCTVSTRKPRAGEKHTRGSDLPDGPFTYETWQKIKNGIIAYEIVPLNK